jgi:hypothetical protein
MLRKRAQAVPAAQRWRGDCSYCGAPKEKAGSGPSMLIGDFPRWELCGPCEEIQVLRRENRRQVIAIIVLVVVAVIALVSR